VFTTLDFPVILDGQFTNEFIKATLEAANILVTCITDTPTNNQSTGLDTNKNRSSPKFQSSLIL
jgi:hypothetical protein